MKTTDGEKSPTPPPVWVWVVELLIVLYYVVEPISSQLQS